MEKSPSAVATSVPPLVRCRQDSPAINKNVVHVRRQGARAGCTGLTVASPRPSRRPFPEPSNSPVYFLVVRKAASFVPVLRCRMGGEFDDPDVLQQMGM